MEFRLISRYNLAPRNMLNAILHLYKHNLHYGDRDEEKIVAALEEKGYPLNVIDRTINWLQSLTQQQDLQASLTKNSTMRIFSPEECEKINSETRAYITQLELSRVINHVEREIIIAHIMQIDEDEISLEQIKRIILVVLFNQSDQYKALFAHEHILADDKISIN